MIVPATVRNVLQAIVDHCVARDGLPGRLDPTSPLIAMATEALAAESASPARLVRPRLPPRVGLTEEQKARRRNTLGSSEIAAVCGVNPYQTVHQVFMSKVHGADFEGNEATILGNLLEPTIFAIYADRYDRELVRGEYVVGPEPWMSCTPDARIVGGGLVEAKLVGLRSLWQWGPGNTDEQESDAVPLHYLCQAQWQMLVTGESFCDVSSLLGTEFRTYRVRANAEVQGKLLARGREFWNRYVETTTPPPVDGSEGARDMLKRLYPRSGGDAIEADERLEAMAERLAAARLALAAAENEKRLRENEMKAVLKDARGASGDGWRVRYSETKAGTRPFVFEHEKEEGRAA